MSAVCGDPQLADGSRGLLELNEGGFVLGEERAVFARVKNGSGHEMVAGEPLSLACLCFHRAR